MLLTGDGGRRWRVGFRTVDPIVGVAVSGHRMWAVEGRLGVALKGSGRHPGLTVFASRDGGRSWRRVGTLRSVAPWFHSDCGLAGPIPFALAGGSLWAIATLPRRACRGPAATLLRRSSTGHWTAIRHSASFVPTALIRPTRSVGYVLGQTGLERSTDGGHVWTQVLSARSGARPSRAAAG